jgi:hypothetical protein
VNKAIKIAALAVLPAMGCNGGAWVAFSTLSSPQISFAT